MGNQLAEKNIFKAFLDAAPEFAGCAVATWRQPENDPPDILCRTEAGRRIGVELTEWLDQDQIRAAKGMEATQESILQAIQPEPPNETKHIDKAWFSAIPRARIKPGDKVTFRSELLNLVKEVDMRWPTEGDRQSPQGCRWRDFSRYSTLRKYLSGVKFFPQAGFLGSPPQKAQQRWLRFPSPGGAYSENSMVNALLARLGNKIRKYAAKPDGQDEFHLLVYYSQALEYNSPVETPTFTFSDAARKASAFIADDPGVFDKIFLFIPYNSPQQVFTLY